MRNTPCNLFVRIARQTFHDVLVFFVGGEPDLFVARLTAIPRQLRSHVKPGWAKRFPRFGTAAVAQEPSGRTAAPQSTNFRRTFHQVILQYQTGRSLVALLATRRSPLFHRIGDTGDECRADLHAINLFQAPGDFVRALYAASQSARALDAGNVSLRPAAWRAFIGRLRRYRLLTSCGVPVRINAWDRELAERAIRIS